MLLQNRARELLRDFPVPTEPGKAALAGQIAAARTFAKLATAYHHVRQARVGAKGGHAAPVRGYVTGRVNGIKFPQQFLGFGKGARRRGIEQGELGGIRFAPTRQVQGKRCEVACEDLGGCIRHKRP
jgi:hypothetical protein